MHQSLIFKKITKKACDRKINILDFSSLFLMTMIIVSSARKVGSGSTMMDPEFFLLVKPGGVEKKAADVWDLEPEDPNPHMIED